MGASQYSSGESAERPQIGGQHGAGLRDGVPQEGNSRDTAPAGTTGPEGQSVAGASRSMASEGAVNADSARQRLVASIDPAVETAADFVAKVHRLAVVLESMGQPVAGLELAEIASKGEYTALVHELAIDSQVTMLKNAFHAVLINDGISDDERAGRSRALIELLRLRGHRVSPDAERMFSTATNSPQQTPERLNALGPGVQQPLTPVVPKPKTQASPNKQRRLEDWLGDSGGGGRATPHVGGFGGQQTPHGNGFGGHSMPHVGVFGGQPTPHSNVFGNRQTLHGGGLETPRGRNRDLDEVSNNSPPRDNTITEALDAQSRALMQTMQAMQTIAEKQGRDKKLSSTIRVHPTVQWPKLGDGGPDCREVSEFFEAFEDTVALANDGAGMSDKERLRVHSAFLRSSRLKTYENMIKRHRAIGEVESSPVKVQRHSS